MPSELNDAAAGVMSGALSWGEAKIKEYAKKLRNKELAFIQDSQTIELVKEQLRSGEWSLYRNYLKDKELKLLVQMGLTLRKLEGDKDHEPLHNLRDKIRRKYGTAGLHIAEFVEANVLKQFIGTIADKAPTEIELCERVENLLCHLETQTIFVKQDDDLHGVLQRITTRLDAHAPETFIVFTNRSAVPKGQSIRQALASSRGDYEVEVEESSTRFLIILSKRASSPWRS